jgi:hypothetical protein
MALEFTDYYGISLGASLLLLLLLNKIGARVNFFSAFFCRVLFFGVPRGEAALLVSFVVANALCVGFAVSNVEDVIERLSHVVLINLIPTLCGAHMNPLISLGDIRYNHYLKLHGWLGAIVAIEGTICVILTALHEDAPGRGLLGILVSILFSSSM